jgi:hypothetical protein
VESERKAVEQVNAAERNAGLDSTAASKAEQAAEEATKPRRKPPTLMRPGEKPGDPDTPPKPKN